MRQTHIRIVLLSLLWLSFTACTKKESAEPPAASAPVPAAPITGSLVIEGKTQFKGTAPKAEKVRLSGDPVCAKAAGGSVTIERVKVSTSGELANAFVYIKEGPSLIPAGDMPPVELDQRHCEYQPHVIGLQVNQILRVINSDPTMHNVNIQGKRNASANFGMPTKGQIQEKRFTVPEVMIRTKCDVHGWMTAYIGVVEHRHFKVTGTDGAFRFADLAPGNYVLEAWHETMGTQLKNLELKEGASEPVVFEFSAP